MQKYSSQKRNSTFGRRRSQTFLLQTSMAQAKVRIRSVLSFSYLSLELCIHAHRTFVYLFNLSAAIAAFPRLVFNLIQDKLRIVKPGENPLSGIQFIDTPGHTPDHISLIVESKGESLFAVGDLFDFKVSSSSRRSTH